MNVGSLCVRLPIVVYPRVLLVSLWCDVLQIGYVVVHSVSVFVIDLISLWTRTNEGFRHEAMNHNQFLVDGYTPVTIAVDWSQYSFLDVPHAAQVADLIQWSA